MSANRTMVSKRLSADGIMVATPCILHAVTVHATTAGGAVLLYDNASAASGTVVADLSTAVDAETIVLSGLNLRCENGLYANLTTAGVMVYYSLED